MKYLKQLIQKDNFDSIKEMKEFFIHYSEELEKKNEEAFNSFLIENKIEYKNLNELTIILNEMILKIEEAIQEELFITSFSEEDSIRKIFFFMNCYIDPYHGLYIKEEAVKRIVMDNPLLFVKREIGDDLYQHYLDTNPILLMAIGRFSEEKSWNYRTVLSIKKLTLNDFELRENDIVIIKHNVFTKTVQKIIDKKCFNTHDKLLGVHIVTTLPKNFDLKGKAPILRTVTKMIHYHKEMELFNKGFKYISQNYPKVFTNKVHKILKSHIYEDNAPLFNTNDVIEGLANRYIDKQIFKMVEDFPELKKWAKVHDITHLLDGEAFSLSLWRLTSWNLGGSLEHTIKMYRDDIIADMLIKYYSEEEVVNGVIISFLDSSNNVYESIKRIHYNNLFKDFKLPEIKEAIILHHNDADGISSGFIINSVLNELGVKTYRYSLEIMFPHAIDIILKQYGGIPIFIVDLGTQIVSKFVKDDIENEIIIIDHHKYDCTRKVPENVHIFNPRTYGIDADFEGSSSINAHRFALSLIDNFKYSSIGLIGAIGDGMYKRNKNNFIGLDAIVLAGAENYGDLKFKNNNYWLQIVAKEIEFTEFVRKYINVLGSVGYESGGINLAFQLLEKKIPIMDPRISHIRNLKRRKYEEVIKYFISSGFEEGKNYYSFNVYDKFSPMGVKEIGNFLDSVIYNKEVELKDDKYLFGAQKVMPVKGIGEVVNVESLKLSMRVGKGLVDKIKKGELPDLAEISNQFENIPGGIHALSAAVIIPVTEYQNVLNKIDDFISNYS